MKYLLIFYFVLVIIIIYRYNFEYLEGFKQDCIVKSIPLDSKCNTGELCYMIDDTSIENGCTSINSISSGYCSRDDACVSGKCDLSKKACVPLFPPPLDFKRTERNNC